MSRTYRLAGSIVLAASLSLLSACSILPKPEQVDVYWLPYAQTPIAASRSAPVTWSLRLDKPMASNALNSQNIAVVPQGNLISNYKGARWSDPAPVLFDRVNVLTFEGIAELDAAVDAALADAGVKGIVITSAKPDFAPPCRTRTPAPSTRRSSSQSG